MHPTTCKSPLGASPLCRSCPVPLQVTARLNHSCKTAFRGQKTRKISQRWQGMSSSSTLARSGRASLSVKAEISYVMVKPDGVQRALVGEIISRFERKGFTLKGLRMFVPSKELAEEHYKDLSSKPFFKDLVSYITSGPVVAMVWEGEGVVASARKLIGATNPLNAEPGTIRGDLAVQTGRNVVHGSDSPDNGERETGLWFGGDDAVVNWTPALKDWLRE